MSETVLPLAALDAGALGLAGGKALNLGVLARAGFRVPPGFCVTTAAYDLATADPGVRAAVAALTGAADGDADHTAHAARVRDALTSAPMPAEVAAAVTEAYDGLGGGAVAVRSSATAEDLPYASFAGQQDTYLGVTGADAVLDAVRRCWASLWTDRAVAYRTANGIDHRSVRLAVVVQEMVAAEVAGVLFTADPLTGRRGRAVVDASPGLGEAVVSGMVNPDHFAVDARTGEVLERVPGDKRVRVRQLASGGTERVEVPPDDAVCVTDARLAELARTGRAVEEHYGAPQDIEWAVDAGGLLWLTQARPITTLYPLPDDAPPPDDPAPRVYWSANVAQGVMGPLTPMGQAVFRLIGSTAAEMLGRAPADPYDGPPVLKIAAGRLFLDATTAVRSRIGRQVVPEVFQAMEARSAPIVRALFADPRLSVRYRSALPFLRSVAPVLLRLRAPLRIAATVRRPASARALMEAVERDNRAATEVPAGATAEERLAVAERAVTSRFVATLPGALVGVMVPYIALQGAARRLLRGVATAEEIQTALRGLPYNPTTEMDLELWRIADDLGRDPEVRRLFAETSAGELSRRYTGGGLPAAVRSAMDGFLAAYGHRGVAEIDLGVPRWSDDPAHIFNVLAGYLRLDDPALAPDAVFARAAAAAEAMVATLAARAAARRGRLRGRAVGFCLGRIRQVAGLRERPKFNVIVLLAGVRAQLRLVGEELARRGLLAEADDVFFVGLREVRAGLGGRDLREVVRERREWYAEESRRRHVPRVLLSDGTEPEMAAAPVVSEDGVLTGSPASAGSVTATVRVVLDPADARLEPGEILVAPSTDPGWTPLFLTAGGLVMEMGGAMSHGAVVAREYGIPAVVGVPDATTRLTTGTRVTVDGAAGTVTPEPPAN
ncbi:MAG TPA: PEP/pyruvate-binding domain-containing protein [Streptosporangiaceae bacterium]|jgi:pyruvate,water dikinase